MSSDADSAAEETPEERSAAYIRLSYQQMQQASAGFDYRPRAARRGSRGTSRGATGSAGRGLPRPRSIEEIPDGYQGWLPPPGVARARGGTGKSRFDPQAVSDVFRSLVRSRSWDEPLSYGSLIAAWPQIAGPQVAAHAQIESFQDGVLLIRTDSTAWAKQLVLLLPQLDKRIADELGGAAPRQTIVRGPQRPSWKKGSRSVKGRGPRDTYG